MGDAKALYVLMFIRFSNMEATETKTSVNIDCGKWGTVQLHLF